MRIQMRLVFLLPVLVLISVVSAGAADVNGTLAVDPARIAGADELGRVMLYTPNPLEPGSSISHWDISATPDLLMEPFASPTVPLGEVDLTLPHFRDLGWPQGSSVITIRVTDPEDEGFNDPTVVAAAPSNPGGTTLGGQRLAALQWVAGVWAAQLGSPVEINIEASFEELDCGPTPEDGAVLAAAGSQFLFFDFPNAPMQGTWYHGALAEALAEEDLSTTEDGFPPEAGELIITFNSQIDEGCLAPGYRYYYGLDGNTPPGLAPFSSVALHEISHGLGFANFVNDATGSPPDFPGLPPMPDIYSVFTFDSDEQLHWSEMTNTQRRASAVNTDRVVWDGPQTTNAAPAFLDNAPSLTINSPSNIEGSYGVQPAQFGPAIDLTGISGDLAAVDDGSQDPMLGCNSLVNASEIAGKIAVVDRGECFFTEKVKNAQNAGAVAVIVVNNQPTGLPPMGGDDATITIPSAGISQADGDLIKAALGVRSVVIRRGGLRVTPGGPITP
ncbi:MAG: peptidase [Acidobacteriota bacterium]|nr:peptidase [Acidobacteriota bacterium]